MDNQCLILLADSRLTATACYFGDSILGSRRDRTGLYLGGGRDRGVMRGRVRHVLLGLIRTGRRLPAATIGSSRTEREGVPSAPPFC